MHQLVKDTVQLVTVSLQGLSQNLIGLLPGWPGPGDLAYFISMGRGKFSPRKGNSMPAIN